MALLWCMGWCVLHLPHRSQQLAQTMPQGHALSGHQPDGHAIRLPRPGIRRRHPRGQASVHRPAQPVCCRSLFLTDRKTRKKCHQDQTRQKRCYQASALFSRTGIYATLRLLPPVHLPLASTPLRSAISHWRFV